jgi:hypothetical protein
VSVRWSSRHRDPAPGEHRLSIILSALTRPPQAEAGDVEVPRVDEGESIAAAFGTVKLAPNVVWWGDVTPEPIKGAPGVRARRAARHDRLPLLRRHAGRALLGPGRRARRDRRRRQVQALDVRSDDGARTTPTRDSTTTTNEVVTPPLPLAYACGRPAIDDRGGEPVRREGRSRAASWDAPLLLRQHDAERQRYLESKVANPFPAYRGLCYACGSTSTSARHPTSSTGTSSSAESRRR